MSNLDKQALRTAAENATPGEWCADDYHGVIADAGLNANYYIASCSGPDNRANKRFIAAANPATVLALLDELEAAEKRIAELEAESSIEAKRLLSRRAAMLQGADGNSPVIPDGWVACSERMPQESGRYWCYIEEQNDLGKSHYQWNCSWNGDRWWVESENGGRVTHWMPLPAAPQQEA